MLSQKNYDGAIKYFSAAIKADPRNATAYSGLGNAYSAKHDLSHATQYLEYALRLNPGDQGLRKNLGNIYQGFGNQFYQRQDKPHAIAWWTKAVNVDPSNTQLASYLNTVRGPAQTGVPSGVPAPGAQPQVAAVPAPVGQATVGPTPGINPWIMGLSVACLGAIMLFFF